MWVIYKIIIVCIRSVLQAPPFCRWRNCQSFFDSPVTTQRAEPHQPLSSTLLCIFFSRQQYNDRLDTGWAKYGSVRSSGFYDRVSVCFLRTTFALLMKYSFVLSSVLSLTLGRSLTIWHPASRTTPSPTRFSHLTPQTSRSTNPKHLSPGWPTSLRPPISPRTLQILTPHHTWPLAPVETPQGWWPTPLGATPTSSPRAQDKSYCSPLVIMVSHQVYNVWSEQYNLE